MAWLPPAGLFPLPVVDQQYAFGWLTSSHAPLVLCLDPLVEALFQDVSCALVLYQLAAFTWIAWFCTLQWKYAQRNFNKTFTGLYSLYTLPTHCHTPVYLTTSNHVSFLSWLKSGLVPVLQVPFLCPLEGHIHLQMQCEVGCSKVEERGFLVSSRTKWKPIRSTCTALVLITAGRCFCRPCLKM